MDAISCEILMPVYESIIDAVQHFEPTEVIVKRCREARDAFAKHALNDELRSLYELQVSA